MGKEKKEIGKLIELAIKYDREKEGTSFDWSITNGDFENHIYQKYLISKEYGFIKWLVENDKIDLVKFSDKLSNSNGTMEDRYRYLNSDFGLYHTLLMLLSISDTPIDFLCGILK